MEAYIFMDIYIQTYIKVYMQKCSCIYIYILAFGSVLLVVCLCIGLHMYLCGCVSMCLLCILHHCASDMKAVMQLEAPTRWHSGTILDYQCYD